MVAIADGVSFLSIQPVYINNDHLWSYWDYPIKNWEIGMAYRDGWHGTTMKVILVSMYLPSRGLNLDNYLDKWVYYPLDYRGCNLTQDFCLRKQSLTDTSRNCG